MTKIVEKLTKVELETSLEKGGYDLFAIFLREDSSDKWDILVSADWIDEDKEAALKYIAHKIQSSLDRNDLISISGIVIIDESNPALPALQQAFNLDHSFAEIKNSSFFGLQIKHGFIITSRRKEVV